MAALRVLVCSQITGLCEAVERSAAAAGCRVALQQRTPAEIERGGAHHEDWRSARVVLADPGSIAHMVDDAAALHWMQATWAGVNSVFALSKKRDFTLTRLGGCFGTQMSEFVLGYVLMHERRLLQATRDQVERRWQPETYKPSDPLGPRPLDSLTLGMLGCGDIGSRIAKAVKGLGMRVVAFRKNQGRQDVSVDKMVTSVADVLAESDYIVNILPSTPDTRGLLGLDTWLHCAARGPSRRPPVFINVGRGDVTSEDALLGALDQGLLQAAVLDVFEVEPLAKSSRLWSHPQVLITPHVSAVSYANDVAGLFTQNLKLYLDGSCSDAPKDAEAHARGPSAEAAADLRDRMLYVVDWEQGY